MATKPPTKPPKSGSLASTPRTQKGALAGGARVDADYLDRSEPTVGVALETLKDFRDSAVEEFFQFSIGGFFASGSFWLGLERAITVAGFWTDLLFWICVFAFIAGTTIGGAGLRQLWRRRGRMNRIIDHAERLLEEREAKKK